MNTEGPKGELIREWQTTFTDVKSRNELVEKMIQAKLFPDDERAMEKVDTSWYTEKETQIEKAAGLFPDLADPLFIAKLYRKREFAELKQPSMSEMIAEAEKEEMIVEEKRKRGEKIEPEIRDFEISPVQRFVSRFLSPSSPYNSALLYHGVGVGKTCAAVTTAETFLEKYPKRPVIILAPPNIQDNFRREIFDINKVKWGDGETIPNQTSGCTGNLYLQLAGCLMKRKTEASLVKYRVEQVIRKRYQIFGYLEFANYVVNQLQARKGISIKAKDVVALEKNKLREIFSGRMIIVDEAHNLRESLEGPAAKKEEEAAEDTEQVPDATDKEVEEGEDDDADASPEDKKAHEEGKRSAMKLMEVLDQAEGTKLLLLTATPMYNDPGDLVFLLNLLLRNDKRALLSMLPPGVSGSLFKKDKTLTEEGKILIANAASAYISYMRGENPLNFPVRLKPLNAPFYKEWAMQDVNGGSLVDANEENRLLNLPFIPCVLRDLALSINTAAIQSVKKVTANYNSEIFFAQTANIVYPIPPIPEKKKKEEGEENIIKSYVGEKGFKKVFSLVETSTGAASAQYNAIIDPSWMDISQIGKYSPKMEFVVKRLQTCDGVAFVYSRFIKAGGLALALALEVNGYKAAGARSKNILAGKDFVGQCALCEKKANNHSGSSHPFTQAHYVFLSGDTGLSGNNRDSIEKATIASGPESNVDGSKIKVIIGSTVAGEGIDLKFIREIYVLDTWFHLNKLEQILGRGIRNKSHIALPRKKRNVTVYLLTNKFPKDSVFGDRETTDMFFYRYALNKAFRMGVINRFIKQNALDCNLNYEAVVITGIQQKRDQTDSQRNELVGKDAVDLNDQPFTSICDWQDEENCKLKCATPVDLMDPRKSDTMTYDDYGSRYKTTQLRERFRKIFMQQPFYTYSDLRKLFGDIPEIALVNLLSEIVNNRDFLFGTPAHQGYITFRNGYYLFQPIRLVDVNIPMAIRAAEYPVKRDSYEPTKLETKKSEVGLVAVKEVSTETLPVLNKLWGLIIAWCQELATPGKPGKRSDELTKMINTRYEYSEARKTRVTQELDMVTYFYERIKSKDPRFLQLYSKVILCFFWDEYLTNEEQKKLFETLYPDTAFRDIMQDVWGENMVTAFGAVAFRVVNRDTAKMEYYILTNGKLILEKSESKISFFENSEDGMNAIIKSLRANDQTCGAPYGTINVKRGEFVFKTNSKPVPALMDDEYKKTPALEDKGKRGTECAINSTTSSHKLTLYGLNDRAAGPKAFGTTLGLNATTIETDSKSAILKPNSNMICTLINLTLRMFDAKGAEEKRWFFRPISTIKSGHPSAIAEKYKAPK